MRDGWLETYRGCVNAWETDTTAHFTVAYYFDRFSDATLNAMESLGLGPRYIAPEGRTCASVDCYVRYLAELRAGDGLHIESAPIAVDERKVTLGHKVYNSETGQLACTLEQLLLHFDMKQRKAVPMSEAQVRSAPNMPAAAPTSRNGSGMRQFVAQTDRMWPAPRRRPARGGRPGPGPKCGGG